MQISQDAVIAPAKLTQYLLVQRTSDDKSKFLAQAGYTLDNWQRLELDLREQILPLEATATGEQNRFGDVYEIQGNLLGPNGTTIAVITIWMLEYSSGITKFITLFPSRRR
jgi:hypothetical protein